jgi:Immunoglobulin-like domain of bacterial spore germination
VPRPRLTVAQTAAGVLVTAALLAAGCGGASKAGDGTSATVREPTSTAADGRAPIVVEQPRDGDQVGASVRVRGTATVFEGSVSVVLAGPDGRSLAEKTLQASCGNGCRGRFGGRIAVPDGYRGPATLRLFEASAEDGSPLHEVDIRLDVG